MGQAVVATEDERFYRHDGIDAIGILRAIPYDVSHFSLAEGASTITEQLAKLVYLGGNDHNPWRSCAMRRSRCASRGRTPRTRSSRTT